MKQPTAKILLGLIAVICNRRDQHSLCDRADLCARQPTHSRASAATARSR